REVERRSPLTRKPPLNSVLRTVPFWISDLWVSGLRGSRALCVNDLIVCLLPWAGAALSLKDSCATFLESDRITGQFFFISMALRSLQERVGHSTS
ncbi:hypothetical protein LINPERHAP2_LOCUS16725, partial [Linum perenne]